MRLPFLSMFMTSPFDGMQEHAEVVKDCAWVFQEAVECHISYKCSRFDSLRGDIKEMEREADAYALVWLNAACIPPRRFADLLSRLDKGDSGRTSLLSSHPGTRERIRPFLSPGTCTGS